MTSLSISADMHTSTPKVMLWAGRAMSGLFVLFMLFDSIIKLTKLPVVAETMTQLRYPPGLAFGIGVMELVLLGLYIYPRTAILGAILLTGLFGGAISTHVRVGDPLFSHVLFGVYLGLLAWGGLWLRDAGLRRIIPLAR